VKHSVAFIFLLVSLCASACGDDDASTNGTAHPHDAAGDEICPEVGRPEDGTPCSHIGAYCGYDAELTGHLIWSCMDNCTFPPCVNYITDCSAQGFSHWDGVLDESCDDDAGSD